MDQASLIPNSVIQNFSALAIQGSGEAAKNLTTPLYRQPGYSTNNLSLMELITKPFRLTPFKIDSSFTSWVVLLDSFQPLVHQWIPKFLENFVSPRFNIQLTIMIPGHQFAVLKLGAVYDPSMFTSTEVYRPHGSSGNFIKAITGSDTVPHKFNYVTSLNGVMKELSPSPITFQLKSSIPTNYPMNPANTTDLAANIPFGGFHIIPITPIRFSSSLTEITVQPFINLCDVEMTPWAH